MRGVTDMKSELATKPLPPPPSGDICGVSRNTAKMQQQRYNRANNVSHYNYTQSPNPRTVLKIDHAKYFVYLTHHQMDWLSSFVYQREYGASTEV